MLLTHQIEDGVELHVQVNLSGLIVVFDGSGHGEELVVGGQVQVV